ncbi:MAG: M20/M25/M40 family metallo-hydrolase [Pyrinomonadaceae bacterium]
MRKIYSLVIIAILAASLSAQTAKQSEAEKNLRTHVSYLTSDELEGRRTGERGATYAAGYVSNIFQKYKLSAGFKGDDGKSAFLQPFDYVNGVDFEAGTSLSIDSKSVAMGGGFKPYVYTPSGTPGTAEAVFAVYGVSAPRLGWDDYAQIDVKDKYAVILAGVPGGGNPRSPFAAYNLHARANIAKEKGAKALIVIASNNDLEKERLASQNFNQTLGETAIPVVIVSRETGASLLRLKNAEELTATEKWLEQKPEDAQVYFAGRPMPKTDLSIVASKKKVAAYNVIGILEGRDKVLKNEAIIIGAHYDHLGRGGEGSLAPNSTDIHHGADDNASGTSALLDLVRVFTKEKKNKRTIIFISFGGEEEGLLGSKAYVQNPVFPLDKTVAMFNMDMVGRLRDDKLTVGGIGTSEIWNDLVTRMNKRVPNVYGKNKGPGAESSEDVMLFDLQLNQDGFGPSDHASFYGAKLPVLFFFTGTHSDYHKPSDTAEKINYAGLEKIADFVADLVRVVDSNQTAPVYKQAPSNQSEAGRRGFNVSLGTIPGYGDSDNTGLLLEGVRDGSPAAKAGIKGGDKLVVLAGKEIRNISDYVFMLGELKAGETYELEVIRNGEKVKLKVVPDPR